MTAGPLAGKRVLIVEDQYLIADDHARTLMDLGAEIIGPCASSADAQRAIAGVSIDFAILDIMLAGNHVYPLAEKLRNDGVPFYFITGYSGDGIRADFADVPVLTKPYGREMLLGLLRRQGWLG